MDLGDVLCSVILWAGTGGVLGDLEQHNCVLYSLHHVTGQRES